MDMDHVVYPYNDSGRKDTPVIDARVKLSKKRLQTELVTSQGSSSPPRVLDSDFEHAKCGEV